MFSGIMEITQVLPYAVGAACVGVALYAAKLKYDTKDLPFFHVYVINLTFL